MSKIETRSNVATSLQVAYIGEVSSTPFKLDLGFCVKNDGEDPVDLEVNLIGMDPGVYVTTSFAPGWNPEIVREIKSGTVTNIKYGY